MDAPRLTLDRLLEFLVGHLRRNGIPCREFYPDESGDLLCVLATANGDVSLRWQSAFGHGIAPDLPLVMERPLHIPDSIPAAVARALVSRILGTLGNLRGPARALLDRRNRNIRDVPRCAEGVRKLAGNTLRLGVPFWYGYVLDSVDEITSDGHERLRFVLTTDAQRVEVVLLIDADDPMRADGFNETPIGTLAILADTRQAELRREPRHRIEAPLAYVFATCTHPGMQWSEPLAPEERAQVSEKGEGDRVEEEGRSEGGLTQRLSESWDLWERSDERFFQRWGNDDWFYLSLFFSPGVDLVCHGGRECPGGSPLFTDINDRLIPSPWRLPHPETHLSRRLISGVDDRSTIFGGDATLAAMLDQRQHSPGTLTVVTTHCEYTYIGDDTAGLCRRHALHGTGRLLNLETPMPQFLSTTSQVNWWKTLVDRIPGAQAPPEPRRVNLVGLGPSGGLAQAEYAALLALADLEIGSMFYPLFDPETLPHFNDSALNVARPWSTIERVLCALLDETDRPVIRPPAPYGISGSLAWVQAICAALPCEAPDTARFDAEVRHRIPDLAELKNRVAGLPVAFVVDAHDLAEVFSPAFFYGIDIRAFLAELGTPLRVFSLCSDDEDERVARSFCAEHLPDAECVTDTDFTRLMGALAASDCHFVYTDIMDNRHVQVAGKLPFGIYDIEPGIAGFGRTLRRLASQSSATFRARYRHYLAKTESHGKVG